MSQHIKKPMAGVPVWMTGLRKANFVGDLDRSVEAFITCVDEHSRNCFEVRRIEKLGDEWIWWLRFPFKIRDWSLMQVFCRDDIVYKSIETVPVPKNLPLGKIIHATGH